MREKRREIEKKEKRKSKNEKNRGETSERQKTAFAVFYRKPVDNSISFSTTLSRDERDQVYDDGEAPEIKESRTKFRMRNSSNASS